MTIGLRLALPREQVLDTNSSVEEGAKLYVYQNHTTSKVGLFVDRACTVAATNPLIADSAGRFRMPFLASALLLTLVLKDASDVPQWSDDDVDLATGASLSTGLTGPAAWQAAVPWVTATGYAASDPKSVVTNSGSTYVCSISHTSGNFATDFAAGKWTLIAAAAASGNVSTFMTAPVAAVNLAAFVTGLGGAAATRAAVGAAIGSDVEAFSADHSFKSAAETFGGAKAFSSSIQTTTVPSAAWDIDASAKSPVSLANGANYTLASGSGIVVIHDDGDGAAGMFLCYAGTAVFIGGHSKYVASASPAGGQIGFYYDGGGHYRVYNNQGSTRSLYLTLIRTRPTS